MMNIISPAIIFVACLYALPYVGPVTAQNPNLIFSLFVWLMLFLCGFNVAKGILLLPFSRRRK